jgi:hypothetical protein
VLSIRNRRSLALAAVVVGVVAGFVSVKTDLAGARRDVAPAGSIRCVRAVDGGLYAPERALDKARQVLRHRTLTNQSGTIHLTPGTYAIDEIVGLSPGAPDALARHHSRVIRQRCGERQAEQTWLVLVNLSAAQLVLPRKPLLVVPTARGWRLANPA